MPDWLYDTSNSWVFLLVTVIIGGAASFMTGRAIAQTWRPYWHMPLYMLATAAAVRFFHYALFGELFVSFKSYLVDYAVVLAAAMLGHRLFRAQQMTQQYSWVFRRSGALGWRRR